jgi:hypothetical protein
METGFSPAWSMSRGGGTLLTPQLKYPFLRRA